MDRRYYVYIITNPKRTVLYIGVTNNLKYRIWRHRNKINDCFTSKYNVNILIHFEPFSDIRYAIAREKELKAWRREKKEALINKDNPKWLDLLSK